MRPTAVLLALLLSASFAPAVGARGTPANVPLVRMRDGHGSDLLFRLNPRTLQQVGRPIRTFRGGSGLSVAPDGSRLAFANPWRRGTRRGAHIHFVDIAGWRSMGVAEVGRQGWLTVGWVSPDRVLAVGGEGFGRQRLLWVDATSRKVVARRAYSGWNVDSLTVPGGVAVALGPSEGVGPLRILLADENGGIRRITLDGIEAGAEYAEPSDPAGRVLTPAVTIDHEARRLYVVAARGLLAATVDLASGAVRLPLAWSERVEGQRRRLVAKRSLGRRRAHRRDRRPLATRRWPAAARLASALRHPHDRHQYLDDRDTRSPHRLDARGG